MTITNAKFDADDLITECTLDGVAVVLIKKEWDSKECFSALSRTGTGALIIEALIPGGLLVGAAIGLISVLLNKATGYYDKDKKRIHLGELHRNDFTWK